MYPYINVFVNAVSGYIHKFNIKDRNNIDDITK